MAQKSDSQVNKAGASMTVPMNGVYFKPLPDGDYLFRPPRASLFSRPEHFLVSPVQYDQILTILVPKPLPAIVWRELIAAIVARNVGLVLMVTTVICSLVMLCGGGIRASLISASVLTVPLYLIILITIASRQHRRKLLQLQPVLAGARRTDQTIDNADIIADMRKRNQDPKKRA
jgi:hypothetical protein